MKPQLGKKGFSLTVKENAWWKQVPIEVDHTKAPVKKKKPRHRNTEFGMALEPGTTKKV